jgi:phage terminase small subunit
MLPTGAGFSRASTERLQDEMKTAEELLPEVPSEFKNQKKARMLWEELMSLRSVTEWNEGGRNDYESAKGLVNCWLMVDDLNESIAKEGYQITTNRGELKSNPDLATLDSATNRMLKLSRALRLGGGVGSDLDDLQNVRRAEVVAKRTVSKAKLADTNINLLS